MFWFIVMFFIFASVFLAAQIFFPPVVHKIIEVNERRTRTLTDQMEKMFLKARVKTVFLVYTFGPVVLGAAGYFFLPQDLKLIGLLLGAGLGLLGPSVYVNLLDKKRKKKFDDQLVDTLMILSSSLRGGLSLIQAFEVVVEEIPSPTSEEFGIILGENKMGVSLEDSLKHIYMRMPSSALDQMISAILLARETGGNLPVIFQRIVNTVRENRKIQQNIENLTLQGKIQGVVMTLLPIGFAFIVTSTNPKFFDQMINTQIGRMLLIYAFISQCLGTLLIWKISRFNEY